MRILSAVYRCAAKGIVRVMFVEPIVFIQNRNTGRFDGGYVAEGVPHNLKVVVHFASAAHEKALCYVFSAVAAAAGKFQLFKQMDMLSLHLPVTDKIERRRKSGKTCTDYIRRFFVNILRLFGMCK